MKFAMGGRKRSQQNYSSLIQPSQSQIYEITEEIEDNEIVE